MSYKVGGYSGFKHLDDLKKGLQETRDLINNEDALKGFDAQLSVLGEIKRYEMSLEWLKQKEYKEKVKTFITTNFDYRLMQEVYGGTYESLRNSMHYANESFLKHIGQNTIKLIEQGDIEIARLQFYKCSGRLKDTDIFPLSIIDMLPEPKYSNRKLSDCSKELRFLYNHNLATMQNRIGKLDSDNLKYIQWVLHSDSETASAAKSKLLYLLLGGVALKDAVKYIETIDN
jgi:hypothetical protein